MQDDDLRTPLKPRSRWRRLWERRPTPARAAIALTGAALGALAVWAVMTPMPEDLMETASAPIAPVDPAATGSTSPAAAKAPATTPAGGSARRNVKAEEEKEGEFEILSAPSADIPDAASLPRSRREAARRKVAMLGLSLDRPLPRAPLRAVSERTKQGLLPRVSKSGRKPWRVYAKPVSRKVLLSPKPKIALVIDSLGVNPALTREAMDRLPGAISLAFAPLAGRLQAQINAARRKGHEVFLQVPMEPWGYPAVNPGPHTLLTSAEASANLASLRWVMSRASGYVGLINYAGQKFLASGEALAPVLHEVRKRGLIFLDDGASPRTLLPSLASVIRLPARRAALRIDAERSEAAIGAALDQLLARAREKGSAIGVGTAFGVTVRALAGWLEEHGDRRDFLLVPASAIYMLEASK